MPEPYNHMQYGWRHAIANVSIAKFLHAAISLSRSHNPNEIFIWWLKTKNVNDETGAHKRSLNEQKGKVTKIKQKEERETTAKKWFDEAKRLNEAIFWNNVANNEKSDCSFCVLNSSEYRKHRYLFTFVWAFFLTFFPFKF